MTDKRAEPSETPKEDAFFAESDKNLPADHPARASDTPETDAIHQEAAGTGTRYGRMADHARDLERRLAVAEDRLHDAQSAAMDEIAALRQQLAETIGLLGVI